MKAIAGVVGGLVLGCAVGYGIALKFPQKGGAPVSVSGGTAPVAGGALFEFDGKQLAEADLPVDIQTSLYEFRKEAMHRIDGVLNQYAMRLDLARQSGRDKESPLPSFEDLLKVGSPSEEEMKKLYEANKERLPPNTTFDQIKPDIEKYLTSQKLNEALQAKSTEFKAANKYKFLAAMPEAPLVNLDTSTMPTTGNKDAQVVVVEVADYLCPHCQMVQSEVEQALTELGSSIKFHAVTYSLKPDGLSGQLARGAFCARKQGDEKFWAWHKSAFGLAKTKGWKTADAESMDSIKEVLAAVQLDNAAFETCLSSDEAKTAVTNLVKSMNVAGVSGTPTFFVNGRRMDFHGSGLKAELQKYLKPASH